MSANTIEVDLRRTAEDAKVNRRDSVAAEIADVIEEVRRQADEGHCAESGNNDELCYEAADDPHVDWPEESWCDHCRLALRLVRLDVAREAMEEGQRQRALESTQ